MPPKGYLDLFDGIMPDMPIDVFLESIPDSDVSVARCSLCKKQFHVSQVGPRKCMTDFPEHVRREHPDAAINRSPRELFRRRFGDKVT